MGAVDTHVHTAPDLAQRKLDDFEAARQAREAGMAALVLQSMGGVNPWAVEAAARPSVFSNPMAHPQKTRRR
jgi:uncharacterized protein DUF6282